MEYFSLSFFGNTLQDYGIAALVFLGVVAGLKLFKAVVIARLKKLAEKTASDLDDLIIQVLNSVGQLFYFALGVWAAAQFLALPSGADRAIDIIAALAVVYYAGKALQELVGFGFQRAVKKRLQEEAAFDPSVIRLFSKALQVIVWVVIGLLFLQNLGYNISALIAGLGIGGIAIAFALQNVLSDIFASFSIYFDKPFQTGDFIIVGEDMGTVRHIGLKSTRIQSLWGEEVVLPNKQLTEARVHNYRKVENRRTTFTFAVTYQTAADKLRKIPGMVKEIMEEVELANLDRVHWKSYGESGLIFEVMYYADTTDYNKYMDTQQEINLQLKERLEAEGIEFAYPTRTVYLRKE